MNDEYVHGEGMRLTFTPAEFEVLCGQARKHKMPVRKFVHWMVTCFINSVQPEDTKRAN
ncbi:MULTISPECIES: hypothetical protein [unclassified Pseudomonas]|uniref:hypothetical protein n=1 Tax=unclassified Pseudomonas TaxID=196821 RepID=UPI000B6E9053|nr:MULTISPECIES: hypothetical protein [unclassified Pseudomonas]SNT22983.1 hypothetical protein SAMN05660216_03146 [Pseudomonas sp. LAMO17WK12:I8]SNY27750.1 hypothetical protein SAMN05660344_03072 [Pseudomonas sp. LAMO17WK12:I11]SNY27911.1 hypothetical protein SAMN05660893_03086 [Pseudomonas sp. LAMO17WK12:I12]SNY28198.1 hypothetical protein SAMN05660700_03147 [Pseudomonas sp. LAMO17WK12:I7]